MTTATMPTFNEFFNERFIPIWIDGPRLDIKTRRSYSESVNWFTRLIGNPNLDDIDQLMAAKFVADLGKQKGKKSEFMQANSIGKHCINLSAIMALSGPMNRHNKSGLGILPNPPFFVGPRADQEPPCSDFTFDEICALYDCADAAVYPKVPDVTPGDYWRALIVTGWFAGFRVTAMTSIEYSMVQNVKENNGRDSYWVNVPAKLSKRRKGKRQHLRLEAFEHMESIRRTGRDGILTIGPSATCKRYLYTALHKLQAEAGMAEERKFGFNGFRKAHLTELASQSLEQENGIDVACRSAGHSSRSITTTHYINGSIQDRLVASAIDRMRSPCKRRPTVVSMSAKPVPRVEEDLQLGDWETWQKVSA